VAAGMSFGGREGQLGRKGKRWRVKGASIETLRSVQKKKKGVAREERDFLEKSIFNSPKRSKGGERKRRRGKKGNDHLRKKETKNNQRVACEATRAKSMDRDVICEEKERGKPKGEIHPAGWRRRRGGLWNLT